uniref:Uncharacterized protein n=1 Tax=Romanomermis culicivorax TaxID=13658 RepID=A0A915I234_ROMCU
MHLKKLRCAWKESRTSKNSYILICVAMHPKTFCAPCLQLRRTGCRRNLDKFATDKRNRPCKGKIARPNRTYLSTYIRLRLFHPPTPKAFRLCTILKRLKLLLMNACTKGVTLEGSRTMPIIFAQYSQPLCVGPVQLLPIS